MIWVGQEKLTVPSKKLCNGRVSLHTSKSPTKSTPNEDTLGVYEISKSKGVVVVCDGVGGHPNGNEASNIIVTEFEKIFSKQKKASKKEKTRNMILDTLEKSSRDIFLKFKNALSTVALIEIQGSKIRPYHVGDSSVIVFDKNGKVKFYTVSHAPLGFAQECGIAFEDLQQVRHIVFNVVGMKDMRIEVGPEIELEKGDRVLIASDGVTDNLRNEHLGFIFKEKKLETAGHILGQEVLRKMEESQVTHLGGADDATFVIYEQA